MPHYFDPLRRKIGVMTLMLACVFMVGWIESFRADHLLGFNQHTFNSVNGGLIWESPVQQPSTQSREFQLLSRDFKKFPFLKDVAAPTPDEKWGFRWGGFVAAEYDVSVTTLTGTMVIETNRFWQIPYWFVVIPLTVLSAWLLLSKTRTNLTSAAGPIE